VPWSARYRGEGLLHNILVLNKYLAWISFSTFSQALKDKGEGGVTAAIHVNQRELRVLGWLMEGFGGDSKGFK
jgi:hypothetical protein